jgi:hypothetical protein
MVHITLLWHPSIFISLIENFSIICVYSFFHILETVKHYNF